ncbi:MAG: hypothetical protein LBH84_03745, partial [Prevotellaceae bacterium]|nr:hypothetical protein [Prevotellaceae bacterium]
MKHFFSRLPFLLLAFWMAGGNVSAQTTKNAQPPVITKEPVGGTFAKKATLRLSLQASSPDGGVLTYKWYSQGPNDPKPLLIPNASESVLHDTTPGDSGIYYYHCVVINTIIVNGTPTLDSSTSQPAKVKIVDRSVKQAAAKYDSYQYLYPELQNGNFSVFTATAKDNWGVNVVPDNSGFPSFGWQTTHYATAPYGYTPRCIEIRGIANPTYTGIPYTGYDLDPNRDELAPTQHGSYAELSAAAYSSIFQEIATVPGKIYEWSLDHITRSPFGKNNPDVMGVVIGASLNLPEDYGATTSYYNKLNNTTNIESIDNSLTSASRGGPYVYGVNQYTYFQAIVDKVMAENGIVKGIYSETNEPKHYFSKDFNSFPQTYTTVYNGNVYYVSLSSATRDFDNNEPGSRWRHRSGSYTVPAGQGTTVFAFVNIYSSGSGYGNVLDDIIFAAGPGIEFSTSFDRLGEGEFTVTARANYVYGVVELRGSTVINPQQMTVTFNGSPLATAPSGEVNLSGKNATWYYPKASGELKFGGLTPSKTYRVVGVPVSAISEGLGANLSAGLVQDDSYYQDVVIPVADVSDPLRVSTTSELVGGGCRSHISLTYTSQSTEYALLKASDSSEVYPWTLGLGGSNPLMFTGLTSGEGYIVVGRPSGHFEVSYKVALSRKGCRRVNTYSCSVKDILPQDVTLSRQGGGSVLAKVKPSEPTGWWYSVHEVESGRLAGAWQQVLPTFDTLTFSGLKDSVAYHIVKAQDTLQQGTLAMSGLRLYPFALPLHVDYADEAVVSGKKNGVIPAEVEFRVYVERSPQDTAWILSSGRAWRAVMANHGGLSLRVTLAGEQKPILDSVCQVAGAANGRLAWRHSPLLDGWTGNYLSPEQELEISRRPAAPAAPGSYRVVYDSAPSGERLENRTSTAPLEYSVGGSTSWSDSFVSNAAWGKYRLLADLGWSGQQNRRVRLRLAATASTFASQTTELTLRARGSAPRGMLQTNHPNKKKYTISNLETNTWYDLSTNGGQTWKKYDTGSGTTLVDSCPGGSCQLGVIYLLRYRHTGSTPSSQPQNLSNNLRINPVSWSMNWTGIAPTDTLAVVIENLSPSNPDTVTSMMFSGGDSAMFILAPPFNGILAVATGARDSAYRVTASATKVGVYSTQLSIETSSGAQLNIPVSLEIVRAEWPSAGTAEVVRKTPTSLSIRVKNLPAGVASVEWKVGTGAWGAKPSVVQVSGNSAQFEVVGLSEASQYSIYYRLAGGSTHVALEGAPLVAWTPYATVKNAVYISYQNERALMSSSHTFSNFDVSVRAINSTRWTKVNAMPYSVSTLAKDSFEVQVIRTGPQLSAPPSAPYVLRVAGRPAKPPMPDSITPACGNNHFFGGMTWKNMGGRDLEYHINSGDLS